jgi:hypothetical protein
MSGRHNARESAPEVLYDEAAPEDTVSAEVPEQWTPPESDGPPPSGDGPAQYVEA